MAKEQCADLKAIQGAALHAGSEAELQKELLLHLMEHPELMNTLSAIHVLELPDCYLAAGYIRNYMWDRLHGYMYNPELQDIDVVYFDRSDMRENTDRLHERKLEATAPGLPWSVKNQARMHLRNGAAPYISSADAMLRWPETATAVGVRLNAAGGLEVLAPHGLGDLMRLILRPSPWLLDPEVFGDRVTGKGWLRRRPGLKLTGCRL